MTDSSLKAKIVRIDVDQGEAGLFFATSPDISGLLVAERTLDALEASIPGAITDLYAACGERVVAIPAEERDVTRKHRSWVKLPAEVAESALARMEERETV